MKKTQRGTRAGPKQEELPPGFSKLFILFYLSFLSWSIIVLQCCASFYHTMEVHQLCAYVISPPRGPPPTNPHPTLSRSSQSSSEVQLICNVILLSVGQPRDSVIYIYMSILYQILFYRLLQNIEYSFLCSIVCPCWLSILYIVSCMCKSPTPNLSLPCPFPHF